MHSTKLGIIIILIALSIGTNYAMISFYNVKLMDLIVFIGGFCFGAVTGSSIGIISWAVYGTLNPMGFSLPIWIATMFSEPIYGVVGALVRKSWGVRKSDEFKNEQVNPYVFFGIIGVFLTIVYDIITNIVFGYVSGWNILFAIIVGFVPFGFIHVLSNALFFGLGCVPAINAILKLEGGENFSISKK